MELRYSPLYEASEEIKQEIASLQKTVFDEVIRLMKAFDEALDKEVKGVIAGALDQGIIHGKVTREKVTEAGYIVVHQKGVGAYIARHGKRVSKIVPEVISCNEPYGKPLPTYYESY